ncbi:hypothetical protein RJ641_002273, partial [Dillenia turbinata]
MAESHKGAASTSKLKDKTSLLDEDIGKEFLSSWKSMSMTDDDKMDFSFATDTKVKKKTFNFGKLDVDFNLDADFNKISSFKMDMADLDFSTPLKKSGKSKVTSGDKPQNGNKQQEDKHFAFSFDFNELESFNFHSNSRKREKKCNNIDIGGAASVDTDNQGSTVYQVEGNIALEDGGFTKLPVPENAALSKFESSVSGGGDIQSENGINASIYEKAENLVVSAGGQCSEEKLDINAQEKDQESNLISDTVPMEEHAMHSNLDSSMQSESGNEPNQCAIPESNTEVCSVSMDVNACSGEEENINLEIPAVISKVENSSLRTSPTHGAKALSNNNERKILGKNDHLPVGIVNGTNVANCDPALEDSLLRSFSEKLLHDPNAVIKEQSSLSMPLLNSLNRRQPGDGMEMLKGKEAHSAQSKFFKRSVERKSQSCLASSSQTDVLPLGSSNTCAVHKNHGEKKGEGFDVGHDQSQSKLVATGSTSLLATEPTKGNPVLLSSEKKVNRLKGFGERYNLGDTHQQSMLAETSNLKVNEIKEDSHLGTEKNIKDCTSGFQILSASSSEQTTKSSSKMLGNLKSTLLSTSSLHNSRITSSSLEGNKPSPLKASNSTAHLSSSKMLGNAVPRSGLLKSTLRGSFTLKRSEEKSQEETDSKIVPSSVTEKQMPQIPSLKRKTYEVISRHCSSNLVPLNFAAASILDSHTSPVNSHPPKRSSPTPNESRNSKEAFQRISEEQICSNKNLAKGNDNNVLDDYQSSMLSVPWETSFKELEVPLTIENDGNVEKAESCKKELEDICIMLKKKHEEAKELLVRAIVNNNNLLMLNHP